MFKTDIPKVSDSPRYNSCEMALKHIICLCGEAGVSINYCHESSFMEQIRFQSTM